MAPDGLSILFTDFSRIECDLIFLWIFSGRKKIAADSTQMCTAMEGVKCFIDLSSTIYIPSNNP
jgi:hypothetical protein